ncbi:MAG: hypothetical protein IBJ18_13255 [Phycisphaerales bacterium]|nr:hypothetical protein [Phycisphaerales bacterium]
MSLTAIYTLATIIASALGLATLLCLHFTRRKPNSCLNCHYPRENLPPAAPCPECGVIHSPAAVQRRQTHRRRILLMALILLPAFPLGELSYSTARSLWWRVAYPRWVLKSETAQGLWTVQVFVGGRPDNGSDGLAVLLRNGSVVLEVPNFYPRWDDFGFTSASFSSEARSTLSLTAPGSKDMLLLHRKRDADLHNQITLYVLPENSEVPVTLPVGDVVRAFVLPASSSDATNITFSTRIDPEITITDIDRDSIHELHITDPTLIPGSALTGAASPPSIALIWNGTTLVPSAEHSRRPGYVIPASQIVDIELAANPVTAPWPPQALRQRIVDLFYAGHEPLAEEVLAEVTRRTGHDMTDYLTSLRAKLNSSPYWPTLKAQFDQLRALTPTPQSTPN